MKIMTVLGTRPEIIKLSPLIPLLDREFEHFLVHTGQHYSIEMDAVFFDELKLDKPKYNLEVGSGRHGYQTGLMLEKLEQILLKEKPDLVLVLGDTNSTLAGALSAAKLNIKVGHIEAGCRSFNRQMPEEINRIIADHISDMLFASDEQSVKNLGNEGIKKNVFNVGSLVNDACLRNIKLAEKLEINKKNFVLVTIHRQENTDNAVVLKGIFEALGEISKNIKIILPIHPRTGKAVEENKIKIGKKIEVIKPLGYLEFLNLAKNSRFIMSDSGGIQEEAAALNVPCLILRNETEWTRLVELGKNILAGTNKQKIIDEAMKLIIDSNKLEGIKKIKCPLSSGVDVKIINILKKV